MSSLDAIFVVVELMIVLAFIYSIKKSNEETKK